MPARSSLGAKVAPYLFVLPAAIFFAIFLLVPIGYALVLSTRAKRITGTGLGVAHEVFVGFANYPQALEDADFRQSFIHMGFYTLIALPTVVVLALVFALALDTPRARFTKTARIALFLPYAVPGVIATILWGFLYLPHVSPMRAAAAHLSLPEPNFLGSGSIYFSIANISIWTGVGFNALVLFTGLRAVSPEMYEAARTDGCSEFQVARHIKIPLLFPTLTIVSVFCVIGSLQVFTEPQTLLPFSNVITTGWTPLMRVYQEAFTTANLNSAATMSVILAVATLVLSLVGLRLVQSKVMGGDR